MADRFVKTPADVVKVNQKVEVTVLAVDVERKRISLSMKKKPGEKPVRRDNVEPSAAAKGGRKTINGGEQHGKKEKKRGKEESKPFNNPFIDALRRR